MKNRTLAILGCLVFLLGLPAAGMTSDPQAASGAAGQGHGPQASPDSMVIQMTDPVTSATLDVPLASTESGDRPLAVVNDEEITVDDLRVAVADAHQDKQQERKDGEHLAGQAPKINFAEFLDRLINVKLIVQEATAMGLDELPEVKKQIDMFTKVSLRNLLRDELWKDLAVDEAKAEKLYRKNTDELKITLVVFAKKKTANRAAAAIRKGKKFDAVVARAVRKKTAIAKEEGRYFKISELDEAVAGQVADMKTGAVSAVTKMNKNGKTVYGLFHLEDRRSVDDPEAREAARRTVLQEQKWNILHDHLESLYKTELTTNEKLRDSLDYSAKGPGLEKLLADTRTVAEIRGADPVTVGELSDVLRDKLYHGFKDINSKRLELMKRKALNEIVQKRALYSEALKRGIDKTEAYKRMAADYRRSVLFGAFIGKVIVPEIRLSEDELKTYYDEHTKDYRTSAQVKLRSLAFRKESDAAAVLDKLRKGADFTWVKKNAEGLVDGSDEGILSFDENQFVFIDNLPEDLQKTLESPHAGDIRLHGDSGGTWYVLTVRNVLPAQVEPFEAVSKSIRGTVFARKLNEAVQDWGRKLRDTSDVRIYLAGIEKR